MKQRGLGRGLDALIPLEISSEVPSTTEAVTTIPLQAIKPNPFQPRHKLTEEELEELTSSIQLHGVLQPIVVRPKDSGYELIAGERRWRAAQHAGLTEIPAIVRPCSDDDLIALALIENLQREDLNPIEQAQAYKMLSERFNLTQEEISSRIGKSRSSIANTLRLISLPETIKQAIRDGTISEGHARALLGALDEGIMLEVFQQIIRLGLSVRQTESLVRRLSKPKRRRERKVDPNILALQQLLEERLQTPVRLRAGRKGGVLEIRFFSNEELNALIHKLVGEIFM